jgi:hypothetical protein
MHKAHKLKITIRVCSILSGIGFWGCMIRASARQNFDGDAAASFRNFTTHWCEADSLKVQFLAG